MKGCKCFLIMTIGISVNSEPKAIDLSKGFGQRSLTTQLSLE
ncbi:hypothetical protein [Fervidicoccus fontis]|nr:hypothetical protein [Fervidicoccus fontis]